MALGGWLHYLALPAWRDLGAIRGTERVCGLVVHPAAPAHLVMVTGTSSTGRRTGIQVSKDAGRT